ncbi:MAG TPA: class I SAM-dependent rRNA methyltransferase, partial [Pirellulaceae bacterium]
MARKPYHRKANRPISRAAPQRVLPTPGMALNLTGAESLAAVYLATAVRQPRIFRKRIVRIEGTPKAGEWVAVYALPNALIGYGIFQPRTEVAVRIMRFGDQIPDAAFWGERLQTAVDLRRTVLRLDQDCDAYRVIHAEGDGFPGLVVDRYGDCLSAECYSWGMWQRGSAILERLHALCGTRHALLHPAPNTLAQEGWSAESIITPHMPQEVVVQEYGTRMRVRFAGGHKTGFFCDQRSNRRDLAKWCSHRSVLDLCCYTGGFSLQAKRLGEAAEVTGVDLDEVPLQLARENAALNRVQIRFVRADIFPFMRDALRAGRKYDVVVLDPPKLIRNRQELEEGTRAHFD